MVLFPLSVDVELLSQFFCLFQTKAAVAAAGNIKCVISCAPEEFSQEKTTDLMFSALNVR